MNGTTDELTDFRQGPYLQGLNMMIPARVCRGGMLYHMVHSIGVDLDLDANIAKTEPWSQHSDIQEIVSTTTPAYPLKHYKPTEKIHYCKVFSSGEKSPHKFVNKLPFCQFHSILFSFQPKRHPSFVIPKYRSRAVSHRNTVILSA